MRKLKLQMQMTIDGFVAGPEGQLDWMSPEMDILQLQLLKELTESMDTILLGRKMTEGFITYWENIVNNQPDSPEYTYAEIFVDTPKIVFSKTIKTVNGKNAIVENEDLVESVNKLKRQEGKDIIVYGGANFVSELIKNNLINELNLFINPTAIGKGLKIFTDRFNFKLLNSTSYPNGIVVNQYKQLVG
ncbi:MAG TPA: dihydrofolate reductase family protein [Bacteroidia bacterium]|jgi:dihydrofolate reductase|nr:dihydrofolate reductase family protein [Bacteroidia bacterium]